MQVGSTCCRGGASKLQDGNLERKLFYPTKQFTCTAQKAHKKLLQIKNLLTNYSRKQVKQLSIPENEITIKFDNSFYRRFTRPSYC